jgi:ketosteroid isomerase-like protein
MANRYSHARSTAQTPRAVDVANAYLDAIATGDFARARACLADKAFSNRSPISTFDDADAFIADISRVGAILERMELRKVFVDRDEVCVIVNYVTHMQRRQVTPVVHWMRVVDGKIASIETIFDARVYEGLFELDA